MIWWRFFIPIVLRFRKVKIGQGVKFYGMPMVSMSDGSQICIGSNSKFCSVSEMTALGVNHEVVLRTLMPGAKIIIGSETGISGGAICAAICVEIGSQCLIGANVVITDTDFHTMNPVGRHDDRNLLDVASSPVVVEDNVFIGTNSIILKGVRVGRNSVVGAFSVVTKDVPADSIVAGNPARIIGRL